MKLKFIWHYIQINKNKTNETMTARFFRVPFSTEPQLSIVLYSRQKHINRLIRRYKTSLFFEKKL